MTVVSIHPRLACWPAPSWPDRREPNQPCARVRTISTTEATGNVPIVDCRLFAPPKQGANHETLDRQNGANDVMAYPFFASMGRDDIRHVADLTRWRDVSLAHKFRSGPTKGAPVIVFPPEPDTRDASTPLVRRKRISRGTTHQREAIEPGQDLVSFVKKLIKGIT